MSLKPKPQLAVFYVPCPGEKEAEALVRSLLEEGLIACAQIFPEVRSLYVWEGKLENSREAIAFIKTSREARQALLSRLRELHPYSCPCFLELESRSINEDFATWAENQIRLGKASSETINRQTTAALDSDDPPPWD